VYSVIYFVYSMVQSMNQHSPVSRSLRVSMVQSMRLTAMCKPTESYVYGAVCEIRKRFRFQRQGSSP